MHGQVREAKEAGAAGVMGIITSVVGKHAFILSSYAASLGLDCPVEVRAPSQMILKSNSFDCLATVSIPS